MSRADRFHWSVKMDDRPAYRPGDRPINLVEGAKLSGNAESVLLYSPWKSRLDSSSTLTRGGEAQVKCCFSHTGISSSSSTFLFSYYFFLLSSPVKGMMWKWEPLRNKSLLKEPMRKERYGWDCVRAHQQQQQQQQCQLMHYMLLFCLQAQKSLLFLFLLIRLTRLISQQNNFIASPQMLFGELESADRSLS